MPPKKRKNDDTAAPKAKRQKIEDKGSSAIDSGFQNPNIDITRHILDHLKLVTKDLKALSSTCSSWHVKITTYYREIFAHILPFSHRKYKGTQKHEIMTEIARVRKHISDIQILHFNREKLCQRLAADTEVTDAIPIPWCTRIILALEFTGWEIIDLKKPDPILKFSFPSFEHDEGLPSYSINNKRKQLLLTVDIFIYDDKRNDKQSSNDENDNELDLLKHIVRIYNISDNGKVELAIKREIEVYGYTEAVILRDDGSVWRATENGIEFLPNPGDSKRCYEVYDYPGKLGMHDQNIADFLELNGALKFIVQDQSDYNRNPVTLIYDAKTKKSQELPVECLQGDSYYITYISDSLQFNGGNFPGSCNLDPIIQPEIEPQFANNCDISVSPDGSRILEYKAVFQNVQITLKDKSAKRTAKDQKYHSILQSNILFYSKDEKKDEKVPIVAENKKKKRKKKSILYSTKKKKQIVEEFIEIDPEGLKFWWLSNDIVIATYDNRIAILDFRSAPPFDGFLSFEVPLVDDEEITLDTALFARIDDTSFVVVNVRDCTLLGIKIKV